MKRVGEIIKEKRIAQGFTLRNFCLAINFDPSNWSKIERGRMEFPKTNSVLNEIARVLKLEDEEVQEIKDLIIIESIPSDIKPNEKVLEALPVFFRTTRELKPSEEQLRELIKIIKKN